jgi:hypothetical protein
MVSGGRFVVDGQSFNGILLGSQVFYLVPKCFCAEVDDAQDGSWRRCFVVLLYLAAKPTHVGVDADGLTCPCTVLRLVAVRQGDKASCQVLSCPVIALEAAMPFWGM